MKCRNLIQDPITKKQNIVWFGSYGKNRNYIKQIFKDFDEMGNPVVIENGIKKNWINIYTNYYIITQGPFLNMSPQWGETPIWPSNNLYPSGTLTDPTMPYDPETNPYLPEPEPLFPNTGPEIFYFKKVDENIYIPVLTIPSDWRENYDKYWIIKFEQNTNPNYDPACLYYSYNNKLVATNYSTDSHGVRNSLIQRLSIIKGELWYKASYGLPLMDKIKNKGIYDSIIINIITSHPDVVKIVEYDSYIDKAHHLEFENGDYITNRAYVLNFVVHTIYNEDISIRYTI